MAARNRLEFLMYHLEGGSKCSRVGELQTCKLSGEESTSTVVHHGPTLIVQPKSSLNDVLLDIRVDGLNPGQRVTLQAHALTESGQYRFESRAEYVADRQGRVKVQNDPSFGGSYKGVEPMGLIWGLEPSAEAVSDWPRFVKKNIKKPFVFHFTLLDEERRELHSTSIERWYLADYIERILVTHGKADGCLYLPKKKGSSDPMPVLIDVRGGVHFLVEDRPSLLASHGFATFSLNYYRKLKGKTEILTEEVSYFDMQIFVDVFDYIRSHPRLDVTRVGIVSSCLGSVLSLNAVARLTGLPIRCVAATGCPDQLPWQVGLRLLDGTQLDPCGIDTHGGNLYTEDGVHFWRFAKDDYEVPDGYYYTPAEDINVPMLFFIPKDDLYVPSVKCMSRMIKRIEKAGKRHLLEVVELEGAGHFIDAPFLPLCKHANVAIHLDMRVFSVHGGDPRSHAYALEKAWRKTINWFRQQLGVTEIYRDDWLDPQSVDRSISPM